MAGNQLYPVLPSPPTEYDPVYIDRLVSVLQIYLRQNMEPGYVRASSIALTELPTNGGGLRVGDVFDDGGTLKIVRSIDAFSGTVLSTGFVGTVTVTTG